MSVTRVSGANLQPIESLDDPRVDPYRALKDRDVAREGERFIAEGEQVVRRLIQSDYPVESVLTARRRLERCLEFVPDSVPLYLMADDAVNRVMGFKFHSGVIACGRRKPPETFERFASALATRATILVCPEIANTENLGALIRIAAGFGADAMILGEQCCDPFYRQSVRVSMGTVFQLNLYKSCDILRDLARLRRECDFELAATVLDADAEPIHHARRNRERFGLLFGNEAQGLGRQFTDACDRKLTIPMRLGTDSLNVAISAAVFLYHFTLGAGNAIG